MQNYILWILCSLWSVMTFAQLGVHGDIMLNSSLALVGVDIFQFYSEGNVLMRKAINGRFIFSFTAV